MGVFVESGDEQFGPQAEAKVKTVFIGSVGLDLVLNCDRAVERHRAGRVQGFAIPEQADLVTVFLCGVRETEERPPVPLGRPPLLDGQNAVVRGDPQQIPDRLCCGRKQAHR